MYVQRMLGVLLVALCAGCQRGAPAPAAPAAPAAAPAPAAATTVADVKGIDWFEGGIDAAFAAAAAQNKLVFLYWGAEWCPPCHDLKAHVFPRSDFQQSLRQFVPVYLDGDAPGAQRVADEFRVQGYPSVVVLKPDRTELARISGGSDLASYADVLVLALDNAAPLEALLADLKGDAARRLSSAECRRVAWNDWSGWTGEQGALVSALQVAAQRCPADARAERDRLTVTAAGLAATDAAAKESGSTALGPLIAKVEELLADPARALEVGTALLYLDEDFYAAVHRTGPERAAQFQQRYLALLDALEADMGQSDTVRLLSAARRLQAVKGLQDTKVVPPEIAQRARATLDTFLGRNYGGDARAGIVNSASWVLYELGDDQRLRALLEEQLKVSRTAYYYMPDIADIEERAGNTKAALDWLERGYRESRGPATRFQWGAMYVQGLLRMSPQDAARIRTAVLDVIGELDGPDRIHARARARLGQLDEALDQWGEKNGGGAATRAAITQRWQQICGKLPAEDELRTSCPDLLS
jgi:protein disulfide-isomerase